MAHASCLLLSFQVRLGRAPLCHGRFCSAGQCGLVLASDGGHTRTGRAKSLYSKLVWCRCREPDRGRGRPRAAADDFAMRAQLKSSIDTAEYS